MALMPRRKPPPRPRPSPGPKDKNLLGELVSPFTKAANWFGTHTYDQPEQFKNYSGPTGPTPTSQLAPDPRAKRARRYPYGRIDRST